MGRRRGEDDRRRGESLDEFITRHERRRSSATRSGKTHGVTDHVLTRARERVGFEISERDLVAAFDNGGDIVDPLGGARIRLVRLGKSWFALPYSLVNGVPVIKTLRPARSDEIGQSR